MFAATVQVEPDILARMKKTLLKHVNDCNTREELFALAEIADLITRLEKQEPEH